MSELGLYVTRNVGSVSGSRSAQWPMISSLLDSISSLLDSCSGKFANLIVASEELSREHNSAKIDDEYWADKLRTLPGFVSDMVKKFAEKFNDCAKLRLLHKKDERELWEEIESKFEETNNLCDLLSTTFEQLAGRIRNDGQDEKLVNDLSFSFSELAILNDCLTDILKSVSLEAILKDRLKMSSVIVVKTLEEFKVQEDLLSERLVVLLFHSRSSKSYDDAVGQFIELSKQYHYKDAAKFIVVRMRDLAGQFGVTAYPTAVVKMGNKEAGRVSIVDTGFLQALFKGLEFILDGLLDDDDDDDDDDEEEEEEDEDEEEEEDDDSDSSSGGGFFAYSQ